MKKSLRIFVLSVVCLGMMAGAASAKAVAVSGNGWREDVDGVRVVHLLGTPREMGIQHGELLKNEVNALLNYFFVEKSTVFGASVEDLRKGAAVLEKHIPPEIIEEMKGIAEGSGAEYEKILMVNTFLDVVSAGWTGVRPPGCSNFAALGATAANGTVVHGRNLDWSADMKVVSANTVFFYTPSAGTPFSTLAWPGVAGTLTGMNAEKLSMGEMTSMSSESTLEGVPIMILLRMLLQQSKNLDDAYKVLQSNKRTTGYNVLVTDAKTRDGFIVEMTAKSIVRMAPVDGFLMHTNHFVDKKLASTQMKYLYMFGAGKKSDTFYRYDRFLELMEANRGKVDVPVTETILSDKYDMEEHKITGSLERTICANNTLQSVVMLPDTGEMYVAFKTIPAPDGGYVKLKFIPGQKPE